MQDLWEALGATEVPPLPAEFDRKVHHRLNDRLAWGQAAELLFVVLPYALVHMSRAMLGFLSYTWTGRFPAHSREDRT